MSRKKHTDHVETAAHGGGGLKKLLTLVAIALMAAAVVKELRTPKAERGWHGKIASVVPYELRVPTLERARERLWDPEAEHVVGPRVFGVGWSVNLGKAVAVVRQKVGV
ncbi:hypothetical protein APR04_004521 [Promicromonospora umidemergens]|uniref:DUF5808 domain-containing protein n=1 Tax=Promicromonospora umidemergens TaxID=629679 RepID=A0ABP8XJQ6_9MICO|nr:DUF5808 domain-containing protein [Promicromonospora umidemergens]MCP2285586.1 hypothetical protein [Promicromonospora umidemergens]